jgi:ABC-2 type transport system permease protein
MQLIGILPGVGAIKPYLLTTQFDAWHGFLRTPIDWQPITRGGWVSAIYAAVALTAPTWSSCGGMSPAGSGLT